jgi:ureidoglycolate lyase
MSREIALHPTPITPESFAPFGKVIAPGKDGAPFGTGDAQLVLRQRHAAPPHHAATLARRCLRPVTRPVRVTQCQAAMGEREWLLAVAPPLAPEDPSAKPD